jgi:hypothetical protein
MIRRHVTDYRPLTDRDGPCPECGAPAGEPCASYCTSRARAGKVACALVLVLWGFVVYLGAGGSAFPH